MLELVLAVVVVVVVVFVAVAVAVTVEARRIMTLVRRTLIWHNVILELVVLS